MNPDALLATELVALRARVEKNEREIRALFGRLADLRSDVCHVIEDEGNEEDERY